MNYKKTLSVSAAALTICALAASFPASAETASASVTVTIAYGGKFSQTPVEVVDTDNDGALTINDALYCAHESIFKGGAAEGYTSEFTDYGLSLAKLWGIENGGAYGYYVNDASAWSLLDPVKNGDYVNAFVYSDTAAYSDTYCFFEQKSVSAKAGEKVTVKLNGAGYDENWNPVTVPVTGAEIIKNGQKTGIFTDENGCASVTVGEGDDSAFYISAVSDDQILVPPVSWVFPAKAAAADDSANPATGVSLSLIVPAFSALAAFALRKRNE